MKDGGRYGYNPTLGQWLWLHGGGLIFYLAASHSVNVLIFAFMHFNPILRSLAVAGTLALSLSACSSGTKEGDTNVERGDTKKGPAATADGVADGDSATAGLTRDSTHRVTGKDLYKAAGSAKDRNHDGLAD